MSEDEIIIYLTKQNIKLKEEISNLKKKIDNKDNTMAFWRIKNRDKKERINKAIEYIENMYGNEIEFNFKREQLLEILKGED